MSRPVVPIEKCVVNPPQQIRKVLPFRGALLNTLTVVIGSVIGLAIGKLLSPSLQNIALSGIGLVTVGIAVKMLFSTKNILIIAASVAFGGVIGKLIGIDLMLAGAADGARHLLGGLDSGFNEGFLTAGVLYCVGPMTLMGCIQDGLERKIELLGLKSILDGISSIFLAAVSPAFGAGVLASAALVLVVQSSLTALARPLEPVTKNPRVLDEATAAGGAMMLAIGLGLLKVSPVKDLPKEVYLPALVFAPALAMWFPKIGSDANSETA
ncbi:MAG: DUF554 domain-containing protein [Chthonomonadaceae bacterium]|nr:DUF554 domain-containing protein [Chthonomonadaceae bacterium]